MEENILRWATYLISVVGALGLALALGGQIGGTLGWVIVLALGVVPGGYLLRHHLGEAEAQRIRESASTSEPWRGESDEIPVTSISDASRDAGLD